MKQSHTVTLATAAQRLGWTYQRAYDELLKGTLVGHQVGSRWRVEIDSVIAILRARAVATPTLEETTS